MKNIIVVIALIGFSYTAHAQEKSNKLFEICYYPNDYLDPLIYCFAIIPIDDDSAKTMKNWFSREDNIKLAKNSSAIILTYCPNTFELPTKQYRIK